MLRVGLCMPLSEFRLFCLFLEWRQVRQLLEMYPSSNILLRKQGAAAMLNKQAGGYLV